MSEIEYYIPPWIDLPDGVEEGDVPTFTGGEWVGSAPSGGDVDPDIGKLFLTYMNPADDNFAIVENSNHYVDWTSGYTSGELDISVDGTHLIFQPGVYDVVFQRTYTKTGGTWTGYEVAKINGSAGDQPDYLNPYTDTIEGFLTVAATIGRSVIEWHLPAVRFTEVGWMAFGVQLITTTGVLPLLSFNTSVIIRKLA